MWILQAGSSSPCVSCVLRPYICSPLGGAGFDPSGELYTVSKISVSNIVLR